MLTTPAILIIFANQNVTRFVAAAADAADDDEVDVCDTQ